MTPYTTFAFYQSRFYGTSITTEDDFQRHLVFASASVDDLTFGRLQREGYSSPQDVPEPVQFAVCAAADAHAKSEQHGGHAVASETVGKHSVTYELSGEPVSADAEMSRAAMTFLSGTRWVYRGFYDDERNSAEFH